ncbi:hypothetical protein Hypma_015129 [Hypsizygus marmoreus]|uniref:GYF domain-containing protein n=1 Tax=Hypsizygus marmoreus TaxID=39966 RepID=A0A369KB45_HYPMA|nr:hypothetical protein Hypma_015129 [Hypsizygus marmoreus]
MHFGPEWMRTKHQPQTRSQPPPSPPPSGLPTSGASTYSALVSPAPPPQPDKRDEAHPFRYSKDELLRIFKEGGGRGGLGLEVERWEGVVREIGSEPVGLREMSDSEKKLFQGPLNSDLRRRQSTDYLSPLSTQSLGNDRPRISLNTPTSATGSPMRDRFGPLRRRDSGTDQPTVTIPRKQSLSSLQPSLASPRDTTAPSPRRGPGYTPNFDGVLNSGESWVARRRASEASLKSGAGTSREGGGQYQQENKASEIREEEEDIGHEPGQNSRTTDAPRNPQASPNPVNNPRHSKESSASNGQDATADMARLSLGINGTININPSTGGPPATVPPDLATIDWSYKDPSGQVQGPFQAELMQKWFDDGYFTGDLPMKRTHLDSHWTTVDELVKRHGGSKIFLTLPLPVVPPGLSHRTESPQNFTSPQDQHIFNGPYQPAPLRNLRSSTLDSFGSNPSDSPSSSFGGGRFGNGSPDPNAFGGRGNYLGDSPLGSRPSAFSGVPDPAAAFATRRNAFNDPSLDPSLIRSPAFGNIMPGRGTVADGYSYTRTYSPAQNGWNVPVANAGAPFDASSGGRIDPFSSPFGPGPGQASNFGNLGGPQDVFNEATAYQSLEYNSFLNGPSQVQHYTPSPATQLVSPQSLQQTSQTPSISFGTTPQTIPSNTQVNQLLHPSPAPSQSPWSTDGSAVRRPGPFEVAHPTSANTVIQPVASSTETASPWGRASQPSRPSSQVNETSPWLSQAVASETWNEAPGHDSLTFSNVGQHNQQQQQELQQQQPVDIPDTTANASISEEPQIPPPSEPIPPSEAPARAALGVKSKGKSAGQPPALKAAPPTPQTSTEPSPPPTTPKAAWSKEDEKRLGVSVSLREIQEAEAKKAEARKVAERERERAARVAAPTGDAKDGTQPFTASWGLPTSQAGARVAAPAKEAVASPVATTAPVWTTTIKSATTKKTMKEIQEEEEKRKKIAVKETTAAVATRRAYAETTQKVATPTPGTAWTTVGPSGKSAVAAAAARPVITASSSSVSISNAAKPNGSAGPPRPAAAAAAIVKPASTPAPRVDDPVSPSHDFLKWLSGSLKGLNTSVHVEEIMSMLLSFPMDPDPSTIELISELIYANSTTLDGRRFAAEFISKRKADAASRPKGTALAGKAAGKPISIADVVKATPKPTQPEWGFKVVNKKKKGGRA